MVRCPVHFSVTSALSEFLQKSDLIKLYTTILKLQYGDLYLFFIDFLRFYPFYRYMPHEMNAKDRKSMAAPLISNISSCIIHKELMFSLEGDAELPAALPAMPRGTKKEIISYRRDYGIITD